jgi:predicted RNase H-like nuclease
MLSAVLGVDACKTGWVGVVLDQGVASAYSGRTIAELVSVAEAASPLAVVAIDIPIGLADKGPRQADLRAREIVGARRSSVFMTPARTVIQIESHAAAAQLSRQLTGAAISIQAFSLRTKILEVDAWIQKQNRRVVEVHPEVSFARMPGAHRLESKATWAGVEQRRALLAAEGIRLVGDLGHAGRAAGVDDVLDAAAAAWSARRVASGEAVSLPSPPETFSDGWPCAIWV